MKLKVLSFLTLCLGVIFSFNYLSAQVHQLPTITTEGKDDSRVLKVQIEAGNLQVKQLAMQAFHVHGYYKVVRNKPDFIFKIDVQSGSANVMIVSPVTGAVKRQDTITAVPNDWIKTTLRACDRIVLLTSGKPGFFAGELLSVGNKTGKNEVYRSDLFFQNVVRLTNHNSNTLGPAWAPDGTSLLYTSYYKSGFPDIFKIDLIKSQILPFATFKGTNTGAVFSPSGNNVAMILTSSGNPELYISDSNGKGLVRITSNRSLESAPDWSPDGKRLVISSNKPGKPQLFTVFPRAKSHMSVIRTNVSSYCAEPSWNQANSDLIAFTVAIRGGFQIAVYNFATRQSEILTQGNSDSIEPIWLNDGRHILFTRRDASSKQLCILDTESKSIVPLHDKKFGNFSQADFIYLKR